MRTTVLALTAAAMMVLLAACTAPLEPDDVSVDIALDAPAEVVVGDELTLTADVELSDDRTDVVSVAIEQRVGGEWQAVETVEEAGPSIRVDHRDVIDDEEPRQWRAVVRSLSDEPVELAMSSTVDVVAVDVEARMIQHFINRNAAYAESTRAGLDFDNRAVVPGFFDASAPEAIAYAEGQIEGAYSEVVTPDVESLQESEPFGWPGNNCSPALNSETLGRAFSVTVTIDTRYAQFTDTISNLQTLFVVDGELYSFISNCA